MKEYKFVIIAWIATGGMFSLSIEEINVLSAAWMTLFIFLCIYHAQRHIAESKDLCDPTEEDPNLCSCRKKKEAIIQLFKEEGVKVKKKLKIKLRR